MNRGPKSPKTAIGGPGAEETEEEVALSLGFHRGAKKMVLSSFGATHGL